MADIKDNLGSIGANKPRIGKFLFAAIVLLAAFGAGFYYMSWPGKYFFQEPAVPQPLEQTQQQLPDNLYTISGEIVAINYEKSEVEIRWAPREGWGKKWRIIITADTLLADFNEWTRAKGKILGDPSANIQEIMSNVPRLNLSVFSVGNSVYLVSGQNRDLGLVNELEGPDALLLISQNRDQ